MKPALAKSNVSNMVAFDDAVEKALGKLPTDGSTVDLTPFFHELVRPPNTGGKRFD